MQQNSLERDTREVNVTYQASVSSSKRKQGRGSLMDRGANGGIAGNDCVVIREYDREVDVTGIDNHEISDMKIVDAVGKIITQRGPAIAILQQCAYYGKGRSIHSVVQMEYFGNKVDDKSRLAGGRQCIETVDGYVAPIDIINGLPYLKMTPPTKAELEELPHIPFTSGEEWSPKVLDCVISNDPAWHGEVKKDEHEEHRTKSQFDDQGNYKNVKEVHPAQYYKDRAEEKKKKKALKKTKMFGQPDIEEEIDPGDEVVYQPETQDSNFPKERGEEPQAESDDDSVPGLHPRGEESDDDDSVDTIVYESDSDGEVDPEPVPVKPRINKFQGADPKKTHKMKTRGSKQDGNVMETSTEDDARTTSTAASTECKEEWDDFDMIGKWLEEASDLNVHFVYVDEEQEDLESMAVNTRPKPPDYAKYQHKFLNVPIEKIQKTFKNTTQYATGVIAGSKIRQTHKSPFPALNILRRNEGTATDTIEGAVAAVGSKGAKYCQLFVGTKSLVADVYLMTNTEQFINTLQDNIRERGAPNILISDHANLERSALVLDLLRNYVIRGWSSEAKYQHQNPAERRWQQIKHNTNWVMNFRGVDADCWFLAMQWVCDVMNHTAEKSLKWRPPLQVLTGQTIDISIVLVFMFWDVVHVSQKGDSGFSNEVGDEDTDQIRGRFVGFAWDVGHHLTFKVLTEGKSRQVIHRSRLTLASEEYRNLRLDAEAGDIPMDEEFFKSKAEQLGVNKLPVVDLRDETIFFRPQEPEIVKEKPPTDLDPEQLKEYHETRDKKLGTQEEQEEAARILSEKTPMDDGPLRDEPPVVETIDLDDPEDNPESFIRERNRRKPGEPNPNEDPLEFMPGELEQARPIEEILPPKELIGRSFLMGENADKTRDRAIITELIEDHRRRFEEHPERIKFRCRINNKFDEIVAYDDIVRHIEEDQSWLGNYDWDEILDHKENVKPGDPEHRVDVNGRGNSISLLVRWANGEVRWEPQSNFMTSENIMYLAQYAKKHNLIGKKGWRNNRLKKLVRRVKMLKRSIKKAKLHSLRVKPRCKFGVLAPRNCEQAIEIDAANGDTRWQDAISLELQQVIGYGTFRDLGKGAPGPNGFQKVRLHFVFDVKHDGRRKARLVAGGHLTETPVESTYSSVVSLRGIRMAAFLAELNGCEFWASDIGNAYLESYTTEKIYIVAGPEFGELEGHTLIVVKALYGLKVSSKTWAQRAYDVFDEMGFKPSRAEPDIWMREKDGLYEYICVYVDDLAIVSKDPQAIIDQLEGEPFNFKLKGTGPVSYHLGCDFFRDDEGVMCFQPKKYIEKMLENYERIFGKMPRKYHSPLEKGDHPETDTSDLLDEEQTKIYQSLIGALQWVIQIGRFDVCTAVMTLSRFRAAPRQGHMARVCRIHGYLMKFRGGCIRIRTGIPDYSDIPDKVYDWEHTAYKGAREPIPDWFPTPLGNPVLTTSFVDANLYHDLVSGRSVTGIIHLLNQTPIDWYSKLQATVETATYGSEFVATRICVEQIIELRNTLRYLGVPIYGSSMMFGDNMSVVDSSSMPHSKLHKRHHALSFHKVREVIASKVCKYHHCRSEDNPADVLSKHWDLQSVWRTLQPLLFWQGDTADIPDKEDG